VIRVVIADPRLMARLYQETRERIIALVSGCYGVLHGRLAPAVIPSGSVHRWARDGAAWCQRAGRLPAWCGQFCIQALVAELSAIPFETAAPIRTVPSYKGQKNFTGEWWCATTGSHLAFESWVERDFLISADFTPEVVGISVQPFTFQFQASAGKTREHTPDVFLRLQFGDAVVVDVRPDALVDSRAGEAFDATARLCEQVGWSYLRSGEHPPVQAANLRWLSGYRNDRNHDSAIADQFQQKLNATESMPIGELAECG
jgi:hypothetical protein